MSETLATTQDVPGTAVARPSRLLLSKQQIKDAKDIEYYEVHVPEWTPEGCDPEDTYVLCKTINGRERDAFESSMISGVGKAQRIDMQNVRAKFCSLIIVDPTTKERMFTKPEIDILATKSASALDRVYQMGMERSRFSKEDIEELVGNSDSGPQDV